MAGFDITYETTIKKRDQFKSICNYLQNIYVNHELEYKYRIKTTSKSTVEIYVKIDGSLSQMQYIDRKLPQILNDYYKVNGKVSDIPIFIDYLKNSRIRLHDLTDSVFSIAEEIGGRPAMKTLSRKSLEIISKKRKSSRNNIISRIVQIADDWHDYTINSKSCVILLNQSMEEYIKFLLNEPLKSKIGFKDAVERAYDNYVITNSEKKILLMYNKTRNRIQHRQGKTRDVVVDNMVSSYINIIEKYK